MWPPCKFEKPLNFVFIFSLLILSRPSPRSDFEDSASPPNEKDLHLKSDLSETNDDLECNSSCLKSEPRFFGDVPTYNVTTIYTSTFSYDGIMQLQIQNFFNFFTRCQFHQHFTCSFCANFLAPKKYKPEM